MKLNKPELTLVKDVDEIVIDEGKRNIFYSIYISLAAGPLFILMDGCRAEK